MTNKIDSKRQSGAHKAKKAEKVAAPAKVSNAAKVAAPVFGKVAEGPVRLAAKGDAVAWSARPDALWADGPKHDVGGEFVAASHVQRDERIRGMQAQTKQLGGKIDERVGELDHKWTHVSIDKRQDCLQDYLNRVDVPAAQRQEVQTLVDRSRELRAQISPIAEELRRTFPSRTPAQALKRHELMKQLAGLRTQQRAAIHEAKDIVSADGHDAALLACAEQKLDPLAQGEPLLDMIVRYVGLGETLEFFERWFKKHESKKEEELQAESQELAIEQSARDKAYANKHLREKDLEAANAMLKARSSARSHA